MRRFPEASGRSRYQQLVASASTAFLPISVLLELTHRCHLDCVHCYLDDHRDAQARRRELTYGEICGLIDQLVEAGCLFLTLSGGEIFLRQETMAIARHARSRGLAVRLYTSGTLMTPALIQEIIALPALSVEFSLYSADHPEMHDAITRRPGSHEKTLEAIRLLCRAGLPVVIKTPLMREVFSEYPGIVRLAETLGAAYCLDPAITPTNNRDLSPCLYRLTGEQLTALYADLSLSTAPEIASLRVRPGRRDPEDEVCNLGRTGCAISPFGEVYPTLGFPWAAGNVRERPLLEIWREAPLFRRLRAVRVKDLPICSGCEKFSYCGRCCMWAVMDEGDFFAPSLWACEQAAAKEQAAGLPSAPTPYQLSRREDGTAMPSRAGVWNESTFALRP